MSMPKFYKELLDPANDNSDISEIGPEDLANIVKGVDDMDDALFGFKTKPPDLQKTKQSLDQLTAPEKQKPVIKTQSNDFPEGDLLADISLSDDDFYDVAKNSPSILKNREKIQSTTPKKSTQEKLTKSKKIANLFGLDDEDSIVTDKKKQERAADWLGIKNSPVKTASFKVVDDEQENQARKKSITDPFGTDYISEVKNPVEIKMIENKKEIKNTPARSINVKDTEVITTTTQKFMADIVKSDPPKSKPLKTKDSIFDLLDDKSEFKGVENPKEKKSVIFGELFGDSVHGQKKSSRRSSVVKTQDTTSTDYTENVMVDESTSGLGQYTPSSGARRPGLGRKRETTLITATPSEPLMFQENWLVSSEQETKNDTTQHPKPEVKSSAVNVHEEEQLAETFRKVLANSNGQNQQTSLSLQRTEAQLLTALELQTTQSSLAAVCARQRHILDSQEKQLAQLVSRQTESQTQVEKQLTAQQQRIQQLLEVLTMNSSPSLPNENVSPGSQTRPLEEMLREKEQDKQTINSLEEELQKATLESEEMRLRIKLMEKHYKMEYESLKLQHRREIEHWEDQLAKQKELSNQLNDEFKDRVTRVKESEAELIAQHNERVQRLREEREEDMKQLMLYHKMTLEQVVLLGKLVAPSFREVQNSPVILKPLDTNQISEKEEELLKKQNTLTVIQEKLEAKKEAFEKQIEEKEAQLEQEKIKNEETARHLKQEQSQLKFKQHQLNKEKKHLEEQYHTQRKQLEEMQEKVMSEQIQLATDKLTLAEERAKLDALAKLQGVSGTASFDVLQAKAEVHGALEAARSAEMQAVAERRRFKDNERVLDTHRWKLREMEEDLAARAGHLDRLMQVSEANREAGHKALEEAKQLEKKAAEKMQEVERRRAELREKEQNLIRIKLDIAQEEIRVSRKREQLEHILPPLSSAESIALQPIKDFIDPKMLIMKLRAEREFEVTSKA